MASSTPKIQRKTAVDSVSKDYWTDFYASSGYGKLWVRDIPKRVKAELAKRDTVAQLQGRRQAGVQSPEEPVAFTAIATVIGEDDSVNLEGVALYGTGETRQAKAFVIDFDNEGQVTAFDSVDVASASK